MHTSVSLELRSAQELLLLLCCWLGWSLHFVAISNLYTLIRAGFPAASRLSRLVSASWPVVPLHDRLSPLGRLSAGICAAFHFSCFIIVTLVLSAQVGSMLFISWLYAISPYASAVVVHPSVL